MKKLILLIQLCTFSFITYGQTYSCGAFIASGTQIKYQVDIKVSDTLFTTTDTKSGNSYNFIILSKSINTNSYRLSDGVREIIADILYYEKPPIRVKGEFYHYWINITIDNQTSTCLCEKNM